MLVLLLLLPSLALADLPSYMPGSYVMTETEGFNDYMYELGVNWFTRSIANSLTPTQVIFVDDEGFVNINTLTSFKNTYTKFKFDEPWEEYTADKRYTDTVSQLEGRSIIKTQTPDPSTGYHTTIEERKWTDDDTMELTLRIVGTDIQSKRIYERVNEEE